MRPFRFFFGVSVALILFFFLAKVFFVAFLIAAGFTLVFHVLRSISMAFNRVKWEQDGWYIDRRQMRNEDDFGINMRRSEFAFDHFEAPRERVIQIR